LIFWVYNMRLITKLYTVATILYLIPFFDFWVVNTYFFASCINALIFLFLLMTKSNLLKKVLNKKHIFFYFVFFYFVPQTVSLVASIDLYLFLARWKALAILLMFITNSYFIKEQIKILEFEKIVRQILFTVSSINVLIALTIMIAPDFFLYYGEKILNAELLELILLNINRGRIYLASYEEVLIPIALWMIVYAKKNTNKTLFIVILLLITAMSFLTNFRTKLVMTIFATITSILIYKKNKVTMQKILILVILIFLLLPRITFGRVVKKSNVFSRMLLSENVDTETIKSRFKQYKESFNIFLSSPFPGIGLGNYYHYTKKNHSTIVTNRERRIIFSDAQLPHNIFFHTLAETGLIGITGYMILLLHFITKDFRTLQEKNKLKAAFVLSFWTLFIYSLFNPTLNTSYNVLYWLLRTSVE
jgi:hypothetical protein